MKLQQEGYSKQITSLLEDLNKLNEARTSADQNRPQHSNHHHHQITTDTKSKELKIDDSAIDEESLTNTAPPMPAVYTSTAEFYTSKTITLPSHNNDSSNIFLIDTDKNDEETLSYEKQSDEKNKLKQQEVELEKLREKLSSLDAEMRSQAAEYQAKVDAQKLSLVSLQKEIDSLKSREQELLAERETRRLADNKLELELEKLKQKEFYMEQRYQEKCNQEASRQRDDEEKLQRNNNEKETQKLLEKLNEQLEQTKSEKRSIETQLSQIHSELRAYQTDNLGLTTKYEKQVQALNDQLRLFQVGLYMFLK